MAESKRHRIKFYSIHDGAIGHHLREFEEVLNSFKKMSDYSTNDLIEAFNIKIHFDNDIFLRDWTDSQRLDFKQQVHVLYGELKKRIYSISDNNLKLELNKLDYNYQEDFWNLLNDLNDLKRISGKTISDTIKNYKWQITNILKQKKLVTKYDKQIRSYMISTPSSAEVILDIIEKKKDKEKDKKVYFPKSLTLLDKENIIVSYFG